MTSESSSTKASLQRNLDCKQVDELFLLELNRLASETNVHYLDDWDGVKRRRLENWLYSRKRAGVHHLSPLLEEVLAQLGWHESKGLFDHITPWTVLQIKLRIDAAIADEHAEIKRGMYMAESEAEIARLISMNDDERSSETVARAVQEEDDHALAQSLNYKSDNSLRSNARTRL